MSNFTNTGEATTAKEYERAKDQGAQARRNGAKEGACPYRGHTPKVRMLAEAWRTGHQAADMEIRAVRS